MRLARLAGISLATVLVLVLVGWWLGTRQPSLPQDVSGLLVYVSDRSGMDQVYLRALALRRERLLARTAEPARDPALSPTGEQVALTVGGRLALADVRSGSVSVLFPSEAWRDATPVWRPDGRGIAVASAAPGLVAASIHLVELRKGGLVPTRRPLTSGANDSEPVFAPDGESIVFIRQDGLHRVFLSDGRIQRLTSGFRLYRSPALLPSGWVVASWSQDKVHGIDAFDLAGSGRETLYEGSVHYGRLAPSPDGRWLAATFVYDLRFRPLDALLQRTERIEMLGLLGQTRRPLIRSPFHHNRNPAWGIAGPGV